MNTSETGDQEDIQVGELRSSSIATRGVPGKTTNRSFIAATDSTLCNACARDEQDLDGMSG